MLKYEVWYFRFTKDACFCLLLESSQIFCRAFLQQMRSSTTYINLFKQKMFYGRVNHTLSLCMCMCVNKFPWMNASKITKMSWLNLKGFVCVCGAVVIQYFAYLLSRQNSILPHPFTKTENNVNRKGHFKRQIASWITFWESISGVHWCFICLPFPYANQKKESPRNRSNYRDWGMWEEEASNEE